LNGKLLDKDFRVFPQSSATVKCWYKFQRARFRRYKSTSAYFAIFVTVASHKSGSYNRESVRAVANASLHSTVVFKAVAAVTM
jgi:hypothetical protein